MSISISGTINSSTGLTVSNSLPLSTTVNIPVSKAFTRIYNSTDVAKVYWNNYTITSTPTSIDVTNLTDSFGTALSFATITHMEIVNNDTTNSLTVGGGTNGIFAALPMTLTGQAAAAGGGSAGSALNLTTTMTVNGTHKILTLTAGAGSISVDVVIAGN